MDIWDLRFLRNYFLTRSDYKSRVWDFSHKIESKVLVGNRDFRGDDPHWWITIIDPYNGREPFLLNREFFLYNRGCIATYPMIFLDSNVVNALHNYVASPDMMEPSRREITRNFISFIISHNFDCSPFFYYMEKSAKSSTDKFEPYATERAVTIFTLQTMDEEEFLKTGKVVSDPTKHAWYFEDRGVKSFNELMSLYARRRDVFEPGIALLTDAIYATLLMIALTQRQLSWDIRTKYHKILDFMSDILETVLGNELFVALLCFSHPKEYQRFIPQIQEGMGFTKFCRDLRASAWDLFLLRLPWLNLSTDILKSTVISYPCCLGYICTTEHALRNI